MIEPIVASLRLLAAEVGGHPQLGVVPRCVSAVVVVKANLGKIGMLVLIH